MARPRKPEDPQRWPVPCARCGSQYQLVANWPDGSICGYSYQAAQPARRQRDTKSNAGCELRLRRERTSVYWAFSRRCRQRGINRRLPIIDGVRVVGRRSLGPTRREGSPDLEVHTSAAAGTALLLGLVAIIAAPFSVMHGAVQFLCMVRRGRVEAPMPRRTRPDRPSVPASPGHPSGSRPPGRARRLRPATRQACRGKACGR